ncbi:hypothetical protein BH11MYX4_BH11MYX4_58070 [soil metagenome]
MRTPLGYVVVAASLALAGGTAWWSLRAAPPAVAATSAPAAVVEPALTRDPPAPEAPRVVASASVRRERPPSAPATTHAPPSPQEEQAYARSVLQSALGAESVDADWARDARRTLQDEIAKRLPAKGTVASVDCRRTLCRVDIALDGEEAYRQMMGTAMSVWPGPLFGSPSRADEGGWTMTLYAAREGTTFPALAED